MERTLIKCKFLGSLLGTAIGDSLGAFIEGSCRVDYRNFIRLVEGTEALTYTDDTHMMLGVAESLIENKGFNGDHMARTFVENYYKEPYRGYGPGPPRIFKLIKLGRPWTKASKEVYPGGSFGNGAAMRVAPVALLYHDDVKQLRRIAYLSSHITHSHKLGKEGAALQAYSISLALKANPKEKLDQEDFLERLTSFVKVPLYRRKLRLARSLLSSPYDKRRVVKELGAGVEAFNSVPTAIYSFLVNAESFEKSVLYATSLGGDADTIGAMAGAIAGAYHGWKAIPKRWLIKLENRIYIQNLAEKLYSIKFSSY